MLTEFVPFHGILSLIIKSGINREEYYFVRVIVLFEIENNFMVSDVWIDFW